LVQNKHASSRAAVSVVNRHLSELSHFGDFCAPIPISSFFKFWSNLLDITPKFCIKSVAVCVVYLYSNSRYTISFKQFNL